MCPFKKTLDLIRYGYSTRNFCETCSLYPDRCEYYIRVNFIWERGCSWCGVHSHLDNTLLPYLNTHKSTIDAVVIDECFIQSLEGEKYLTASAIDKTLEVSKLFSGDYATLSSKLLTELQKATKYEFVNYENLYSIMMNRTKEKERKCFSDQFETYMLGKYVKSNYDYKVLFPNIVEDIISVFSGFEEKRKVVKSKSKLIDYLSHSLSVEKIKYGYAVRKVNYKCSVDIPSKVILLDATTPSNIYSKLFNGRDILSYTKQIKLNTKMYQISDGSYPIETLKDEKSRNRLIETCLNVCNKHSDKKVLIISRMAFEKPITKYLEANGAKNFSVEHYNSLRGTNDYVSYDVCILFGAPFPMPVKLKEESYWFGIEQESLRELYRESEMIQAFNRIRPILKNDTFIYILTNVHVDDRAKVISLDKLNLILSNCGVSCYTEKQNELKKQITLLLKKDNMDAYQMLNKSECRSGILYETLKKMERDNIIERAESTSTIQNQKGRPTSIYKLI